MGTHMAVSAAHPLGVRAAIQAGESGGNAVDAACAAAVALAVCLPDACGLGGDVLALVREPSGHITAINGAGCAPDALVPPLPPDGAGTAAVPGFVAGIVDAVERFGRLSLAEVLAPAIETAHEGFVVTAPLATALAAHLPRLQRGGGARSPLLSDGNALPVGTVVRQRELADTLQRVADGGRAGFYAVGPIPAAVERAAASDGGFLKRGDLAEHRTVIRAPVTVDYRGARIHLQPPVSQAILLAMALLRLGAEPAADSTADHAAIEAIVAAFAHRDAVLLPEAEEELLRRACDLEIPPCASGRRGPTGSNHTAGVCVADASGIAVSMLVSVFDDFGCATWVEGAGFLLNDRLVGTSREPGSPNAPAPGRRPVHTLSPSLVSRDGRTLALATPGADGQVQVLLQLIRAIIDRDEPLDLALARPRWRSVGGRLAIESGMPRRSIDALAALGHTMDDVFAGSALFGAACGAEFDRRRGLVAAWSDPRRQVTAAAW